MDGYKTKIWYYIKESRKEYQEDCVKQFSKQIFQYFMMNSYYKYPLLMEVVLFIDFNFFIWFTAHNWKILIEKQ